MCFLTVKEIHWFQFTIVYLFNSSTSFPGGYYTIEQSHSKLRIVVLNSNLWAGGAARNDGPHRGRAQWEWLEQVLSKARRKNEMVRFLFVAKKFCCLLELGWNVVPAKWQRIRF